MSATELSKEEMAKLTPISEWYLIVGYGLIRRKDAPRLFGGMRFRHAFGPIDDTIEIPFESEDQIEDPILALDEQEGHPMLDIDGESRRLELDPV